jgi:hypothetical protein
MEGRFVENEFQENIYRDGDNIYTNDNISELKIRIDDKTSIITNPVNLSTVFCYTNAKLLPMNHSG